MESIKKKVLQLAEHDLPLKAIARSTGISAQRVRRILAQNGKKELTAQDLINRYHVTLEVQGNRLTGDLVMPIRQ